MMDKILVSRHILFVKQSITIGTLIKFDSDAEGDGETYKRTFMDVYWFKFKK